MMVAAQNGDDAAYDKLLLEVRVWLYKFYRRRLSPAAAEDATQEALLAIHSRKYSYEDIGPFIPWLCTIARYKWMDQLRQQFRDPEAIESFDPATGDHESSVGSAILLNRLLEQLKPAQASVIRLVKLNGSTVEEASQVTGQSASLVKVNVHRGLRRIAQILDSEDPPTSESGTSAS